MYDEVKGAIELKYLKVVNNDFYLSLDSTKARTMNTSVHLKG